MTPEQQALLLKAERSLAAARLLADEGHPDFAASRAYYAMLYAVQALLLGEGLSFSKHSAVIAAFGKHFAKKGRLPAEYHRFMIEAHDSRNVGDYDTGQSLKVSEAHKHIARAAEVLASARKAIAGNGAKDSDEGTNG